MQAVNFYSHSVLQQRHIRILKYIVMSVQQGGSYIRSPGNIPLPLLGATSGMFMLDMSGLDDVAGLRVRAYHRGLGQIYLSAHDDKSRRLL